MIEFWASPPNSSYKRNKTEERSNGWWLPCVCVRVYVCPQYIVCACEATTLWVCLSDVYFCLPTFLAWRLCCLRVFIWQEDMHRTLPHLFILTVKTAFTFRMQWRWRAFTTEYKYYNKGSNGISHVPPPFTSFCLADVWEKNFKKWIKRQEGF